MAIENNDPGIDASHLRVNGIFLNLEDGLFFIEYVDMRSESRIRPRRFADNIVLGISDLLCGDFEVSFVFAIHFEVTIGICAAVTHRANPFFAFMKPQTK